MIEALTGICFVKPSNRVERGDAITINILTYVQGRRADRNHGHIRYGRHTWLFNMVGFGYHDGHEKRCSCGHCQMPESKMSHAMHLSDPLTLLQPSSAPTLPSIVFLVTLEVLLAACVACAEYWPTRSCFIVFITLSVSQVLALPAGGKYDLRTSPL